MPTPLTVATRPTSKALSSAILFCTMRRTGAGESPTAETSWASTGNQTTRAKVLNCMTERRSDPTDGRKESFGDAGAEVQELQVDHVVIDFAADVLKGA